MEDLPLGVAVVYIHVPFSSFESIVRVFGVGREVSDGRSARRSEKRRGNLR